MTLPGLVLYDASMDGLRETAVDECSNFRVQRVGKLDTATNNAASICTGIFTQSKQQTLDIYTCLGVACRTILATTKLPTDANATVPDERGRCEHSSEAELRHSEPTTQTWSGEIDRLAVRIRQSIRRTRPVRCNIRWHDITTSLYNHGQANLVPIRQQPTFRAAAQSHAAANNQP